MKALFIFCYGMLAAGLIAYLATGSVAFILLGSYPGIVTFLYQSFLALDDAVRFALRERVRSTNDSRS